MCEYKQITIKADEMQQIEARKGGGGSGGPLIGTLQPSPYLWL